MFMFDKQVSLSKMLFREKPFRLVAQPFWKSLGTEYHQNVKTGDLIETKLVPLEVADPQGFDKKQNKIIKKKKKKKKLIHSQMKKQNKATNKIKQKQKQKTKNKAKQNKKNMS